MAFSTLISENYLRFLGVTFRHVLAETTTGRCSWKEILITKGEEW